MGRRGIKEYRAPEALILIAADRDRKPLVCPSCNSTEIQRVPDRCPDEPACRVTLTCAVCGRSAAYIHRPAGTLRAPEEPSPPRV